MSVAKSPWISSMPLWSFEILRTTAIAGEYLTSVPSLSSASTTSRSEPPEYALPMRPCASSLTSGAPLTSDGDIPHAERNSNIIAVTVDLPLVPATATVFFEETIDARRSERCMTGMPLARAAAMSGFVSSIAVDTQRASASSVTPVPSWLAILQPSPSRDRRTDAVSSLSNRRSDPETPIPSKRRYWARALIPVPKMPVK